MQSVDDLWMPGARNFRLGKGVRSEWGLGERGLGEQGLGEGVQRGWVLVRWGRGGRGGVGRWLVRRSVRRDQGQRTTQVK